MPMSAGNKAPVRRIRRAGATREAQSLPQDTYPGFGSVPGETLDQFHDRVFELDPLWAMAFEMEVALEQH